MATTRCKFRVNDVTYRVVKTVKVDDNGEQIKNEDGTYEYEEWHQPSVNLGAVYGTDDPQSENSKFWTATPTGSISLAINNPLGAEVFELGKDYYVDFTKAE